MPMKSGTLVQASVKDLVEAISGLKADVPYKRKDGVEPSSTQDQWLEWLAEYHTPGFYGRTGTGYDAKYAYNHVQNHQMLIWLLAAAGLEAPTLVEAAAAAHASRSMAQKAAAVRRLVPWQRARELLWPTGA